MMAAIKLIENMLKADEYTIEELELIFSIKDYNNASSREKKLYIIFFKNFDNDELLKEIKRTSKISSFQINRVYRSFSEEIKRELGNFWALKVNRKKLKLCKIEPRGEGIYKEIDSFEKYELTPCIAYEMAIRNKDVQALLKRYDKINHMINDDKYLYKRFYTKDNFQDAKNHPIQTHLEEYENCTFEEYETIIVNKLATYKRFIEEDYKKFIDDYIHKCTELSITELNILKQKIENELINDYLIYPTGYTRQIPHADDFFGKEEISNSQKNQGTNIVNPKIDSNFYVGLEKIIHNEFIQYQMKHKDSDKYIVNNIIPNFKRQINDQEQITIPINFSLPRDEIVEYIEKIKKKLNPKTPLELLGDKLKEADSLTSVHGMDFTKGDNPQKKLSNLMYVYDMKKKGFTNLDIIYELSNFHFDKETAMSENTIKKYFSIAKKYIEKQQYIELITGKKKSY